MNKPKIIVRYLPQFHRIRENDQWWGDGFTEWTAVKKGKSLFHGHCQPKIPLNSYYYDLMKKETMQWQAELGCQYGITGFAFYHYWFKNGKKILEKPAENLLKWKDINMPFCFSWANESWARTWSNLVDKNSWSKIFEQNKENDNNGILLDQKYGHEVDWEKHIHYLLPFFKDIRYIKHNGKPIFMIYKPESIVCLPDMLDCWNKFLIKNGIPGLYIIGETGNEYFLPSRYLDGRLLRFPDCALQRMQEKRTMDGVRIYDYDLYWNKLLHEKWNWLSNEKTYVCAAVDFDSTPRRGTAGIVLQGATPAKFKDYFSQLYKRMIDQKTEYIFINAWNEWGEGMYLEPDERNGYGYLSAIRDVVTVDYSNHKQRMGEEEFVDFSEREKKIIPRWVKDNQGVKTFSNWMFLRDKGISVAEYLKKNGYKSIAIYGMGYFGKHLLDELQQSEIEIAYLIDRKSDVTDKKYHVYSLAVDLPMVDLIIISLPGQYEEIRDDISKYVSYPTVALEYIITESMDT